MYLKFINYKNQILLLIPVKSCKNDIKSKRSYEDY